MLAPLRSYGGVGGGDGGGQSLADFVAEGVEHDGIGAVAFLEGMAHYDEVGDAFQGTGGVIGGHCIQFLEGGVEGGAGGGCVRSSPAGGTRRRRFSLKGRRGRSAAKGRQGVGVGISSTIGSVGGVRRGGSVGCVIIGAAVICVGEVGGVIVVGLRGRVGFVGHQDPVDQVDATDFDIAFLGDAEHEFFEAGEAEFALVEAGDAAHEALLEGGKQEGMAGGALGADEVFDGADDFGELMASGVGEGSRGGGAAAVDGFGGGYGVNIAVVKDEAVDVVGHAAGGGPGDADDEDAFADGAQGIDDMDEVGVAGDEDEGIDVGEAVGRFDAVGRHFDVDAVFDPHSAARLVGTAAWGEAGRHIDGFDAGGVEGGGVVDKLAGAFEFRGTGYPVGVGFADDNAAVVGHFLFEGGYVGGAAAVGEAYFEVFPVNE